MKSVLISIRPQWCEKIANGEKTIEVRKTRPKLETPFKCYIYCTKGRGDCLWRWDGIWYDTQFPNERPNRLDGKVIGEFVCDRILHWQYYWMPSVTHICDMSEMSCVPVDELLEYAGEKQLFYGWHISNLKIYDTPKELDWFRKPYECHRGVDREGCIGCWDCEIKRAPQSWCYVKGGEG